MHTSQNVKHCGLWPCEQWADSFMVRWSVGTPTEHYCSVLSLYKCSTLTTQLLPYKLISHQRQLWTKHTGQFPAVTIGEGLCSRWPLVNQLTVHNHEWSFINLIQTLCFQPSYKKHRHSDNQWIYKKNWRTEKQVEPTFTYRKYKFQHWTPAFFFYRSLSAAAAAADWSTGTTTVSVSNNNAYRIGAQLVSMYTLWQTVHKYTQELERGSPVGERRSLLVLNIVLDHVHSNPAKSQSAI